MTLLFIPSDRIGLNSFQKSISATSKAVNELIRNNCKVGWHTKQTEFNQTDMWPEGHKYQCGYSVESSYIVKSILDSLDIIYEKFESVPEPDYYLKETKIALYDGLGAGREFSGPLVEVLEMGGFKYTYISDKEIRNNELMDYDIFLVPGSPDAGECYYNGLGDLGFERIRNFVSEKGHYMGICGGAYLPLTSYNDKNHCWLNMVEATESQDLDYWHTGSGFVRCRISENEHPIFTGIATGATSSLNLVYWEGPCIIVKGKNIKSLAHFEQLLATGSNISKPYWDMFDNDMASQAVHNYYNPLTEECFDRLVINTTAFAEAEYNGNKILMYSPHPEMGNIGYGPRRDSLNFQLIYNGLFYLSAE